MASTAAQKFQDFTKWLGQYSKTGEAAFKTVYESPDIVGTGAKNAANTFKNGGGIVGTLLVLPLKAAGKVAGGVYWLADNVGAKAIDAGKYMAKEHPIVTTAAIAVGAVLTFKAFRNRSKAHDTASIEQINAVREAGLNNAAGLERQAYAAEFERLSTVQAAMANGERPTVGQFTAAANNNQPQVQGQIR